MTSSWQRSHLKNLEGSHGCAASVLSQEQCQRMFPELYIWDPWPVLLPSGDVAQIAGAQLWMGLAASAAIEPNERHDVARIRLFSCRDSQWCDHGWLFEESASPGSREWAGCATYHPESQKLEVWYTATGIRGEQDTSFIQRIFHTSGTLAVDDVPSFNVIDWVAHRELIKPGGSYQSTHKQLTGEAGFIKAFRDPSRFVDPKDGALYLLFSASLEQSTTDFDGAIGIAVGTSAADFTLRPPLLHADGVNNELERPHIVWHGGRYYLFFSTQARTFHPDVSGPTGLYGFVAEQMDGDWQPLNGSGLVLANPSHEPFQAYSWLVMSDLSVVGFVDFPNLQGRLPEEIEASGAGSSVFGGTITPREHISLVGNRSQLLPPER